MSELLSFLLPVNNITGKLANARVRKILRYLLAVMMTASVLSCFFISALWILDVDGSWLAADADHPLRPAIVIISFCLSAGFLTYFINKVAPALRTRYTEVASLRRQLQIVQTERAALYQELTSLKSEPEKRTPRKQLEEDLEQKKYFLEKTQQTAQIGYWIVDHGEKQSLIWSKETCRIFGITEEEFDGRFETFMEFVHPDDVDRVQQDMYRIMKGDGTYNIDHRIVRRDGSVGWVNEQAEIIRDADGRLLRMIGMTQDITHRKAIEEALREFNERYEILSKATNDVIWDWTISSGKLFYNHGLQSIFNYRETEIELTLSWWWSKIHPDDVSILSGSVERAFAQKLNTWQGTYRFQSRDGSYKYVYDRAYILYNDLNEPMRMIGSMQDISERMNAMEEIEKLSFVASQTDNAVIITGPSRKIEWVNEGFVNITGYKPEEAVTKIPDFLFGHETNAEVVRHIVSQMGGGNACAGELFAYKKSGEKFCTRFNVTPVFANDGSVKNFIFMLSDISAQREFENRITAIARELESLIENANVPIFGIDRNGYINEWNKVTAELCGFSRSEILGKKWLDEMVADEYQAATSQMLASVLWGKPVSNFELPVLTRHERPLVMLLSASPRRDMNKNITGAMLVAQDVTELIEYRQNLEKMVEDRTRALNKALQNEKELVEMKSKFVSIASHEFRTPLSTIALAAGYIKKFKHKISPEDIDRKLENIEKQISHMTHLLDDVLVIGKAEAGKIQVRLGEVNLRDFVEKLSGEVEQTTGNSHRIVMHTRMSVQKMASDEKLLRNIFVNLLTNAIKFSPDAKVVDLELLQEASTITVKVRDYGIGIPPAEVDKVFDPFYRGSNASVIQGTGLGLSIIKKAVDLLQGSVHLKSEVGKGTEITVYLPLADEKNNPDR